MEFRSGEGAEFIITLQHGVVAYAK
jgi:hypothetical protein